MSASPPRPAVVVGAVLVLVAVAIRAWVTEDAYISFRTVENFVAGAGLTWNVDERVQAYTHPLWLFLQVPFYAVTREVFFTVIAISLVCTTAAWVQVGRRLEGAIAPLLFALAFALSKSCVDYGTSGLENPLSYLLLACFAVELARPEGVRYRRAVLWAGLAATNRLDVLAIALPPLVVLALRAPRREALVGGLLGMLPLIVWELFSLFYYGFLFPNTRYAKLSTGVSALEMQKQGLLYLVDLLQHDPWGATAICVAIGLGAAGLVGALRRRDDDLAFATVPIGLGLYAMYTISVGGDFMSGRFWAVPIFLALSWLGLTFGQAGRAVGDGVRLTFGVLVAMGVLMYPRDTAFSPNTKFVGAGIIDERAFWADTNSLERYLRSGGPIANRGSRDALVARRLAPDRATAGHSLVIQTSTVGMLGYYSGPEVLLIDTAGLADALLARIPLEDATKWRAGHFVRYVPRGYGQYRSSGDDSALDPELAAYVRPLRLVISGPLFSLDRLSTILAFNLGEYDEHLADYQRRRTATVPAPAPTIDQTRGAETIIFGGAFLYGVDVPALASASEAAPITPPVAPVPIGTVAVEKPIRTPWNAEGNVRLPRGGAVTFTVNPAVTATQLEVSVDTDDNYTFLLYNRGMLLGVASVPKQAWKSMGLDTHTIALPDGAIGQPIDRVVVLGDGDDGNAIGHILLR